VLRRAGAGDVVVLVSDGETPPVPAEGRLIGPHTSVVVAIEYNGHWAKVTRNRAGVTASLASPGGAVQLREILSGPYSWETLEEAGVPAVVSLQLQLEANGRQLYYGDTCLQNNEGLRVL
jgi:hypothetical protein